MYPYSFRCAYKYRNANLLQPGISLMTHLNSAEYEVVQNVVRAFTLAANSDIPGHIFTCPPKLFKMQRPCKGYLCYVCKLLAMKQILESGGVEYV